MSERGLNHERAQPEPHTIGRGGTIGAGNSARGGGMGVGGLREGPEDYAGGQREQAGKCDCVDSKRNKTATETRWYTTTSATSTG